MFTGFFKVVTSKKKKKAVDTKGYVQIGEDGLFFERLDSAYLNSPTATMVLLKFLEFCVPAGLLPEHAPLWNKIKNDYIRYGYFILNVQYDVSANRVGVIYKNAKHFRVKDKDDNDNASTFINIKTGVVYPTFNPNVEVVKSQFKKQGFTKYLGQIYMYNDTPQPYRITPLYSVQKWMEEEDNSATYSGKACDNAMFGNNIFVTKKSSDPTPKEMEVVGELEEALRNAKGVENATQNLLLQYEGDIEDVTKLISKVSISNDVNVDLFNSIDNKAEDKICVACYNFPKILLFKDSGIFGDSGVAIQTATDLWAQTCQKEAAKILSAFEEIGIRITEDVQEVVEVDTRTADGQAELRSTVGGAQLVLQVQTSVSNKVTTPASAIALFKTFFGLSDADATELLGNPEISTTNGSTNNPDTTGA
jgi:hypothetical protein